MEQLSIINTYGKFVIPLQKYHFSLFIVLNLSKKKVLDLKN